MQKIFIVEDDEKLRAITGEYLQRYGYSIHFVENFKNVIEEFHQLEPHLVLLDINLPYFDGFQLCRAFRKDSHIPIIFTSARSSDFDQVRALEMGADDYLTKPFSLELLLAKVQASLRRTYGEYSSGKESVLSVDSLKLDTSSFTLSRNNITLELSKNELKLLKKLMESPGEVVSRESLLEELWDDTLFVDDNTLTVNVSRGKKRLRDLGLDNAIKTKRGVGYFLSLED